MGDQLPSLCGLTPCCLRSFHQSLQGLDPLAKLINEFGLHIQLFRQGLYPDHQDALHVAGVDGRRGPDRPYAIVAEAAKKSWATGP